MQPEEILSGILRRYAEVVCHPQGQFPYPIGRESALALGYRPDLLASIDAGVLERFVGVGNPFSLGEPGEGWRVVDVGCGAGLDAQMAGRYVGEAGVVIGVDMSREMLGVARAGLHGDVQNVKFVEGDATALPVASGWVDLVISNGVLNLAADKSKAFAEIARVLRPGGRLQAVDLILVQPLPPDLSDDAFAWSN